MKNASKYLLFAAALLCLGQSAQARRSDMRYDDLVVDKGQIISGDITVEKSLLVNGTLKGDVAMVGGGSVTVNGEITGDLAALGGPVFITGLVKGDVTNIGGPVDVTGRVEGDVSAIGGRVTLSGSGAVDGDISSLGGTVVKDPSAVHKGQINSFDVNAMRGVVARMIRLSDHSDGIGGNAKPWMIGGLVGLGLMMLLSTLVTGVILMMLPAVFFPSNVEVSARALTADMWRACWIGALMVMGFFPGLIVMVVSVFGIPLVPFALILAAAAAVLGLSAFSVVLQARFFDGIKRPGPAALSAKVAVGYGIMAGLLFFGKVIPLLGDILSLIGFMMMCFGTMIGLGAVWMTKMGSREYAAAPALQAVPAPAQPPAIPPAAPAAQ
ncbi:MAG: hypothetical protein A2016_02760 [Elusimicrobia bacterium GWF2_62_30]|nr:MAG: hypothetical protein A2016_02760 [Elusimicrobia bacterium GWF2_62_30]